MSRSVRPSVLSSNIAKDEQLKTYNGARGELGNRTCVGMAGTAKYVCYESELGSQGARK
jgi:hypothetical protein